MRDSCGICAGLYTVGEEDAEVEMDRLVLKNPHSPLQQVAGGAGGAGRRVLSSSSSSPTSSKTNKKTSINNNNSNSTGTIGGTSPASPKSLSSSPSSTSKGGKLSAIVETVDEVEPTMTMPVTYIGTVEEEEEEEEEQGQDDEEQEERQEAVEQQPEEKKNDDYNEQEGAMVAAASSMCGLIGIPEEIRTPLSSDFTAVPTTAGKDELENDADEDGLTSRPQRNFDQNPTQLYLTLMRKDWDGTIVRCGQAPEEVGTWIYRKENDGSNQLRWRLLPIHAAIIFGAPLAVLSTFCSIDPTAALAADDQGMVPLHLAVRMGCPPPIIRALCRAAPKSRKCRDRKGRTPRDLALRQTGTVRELMLAALDDAEEKINKKPKAAVPTPPPPPQQEQEETVAAAAVSTTTVAAPVVQDRSFLSTVFTPPSSPPAPVVQYKPDPAMAARVHLLELQLERSEAGRKDVQERLEKMIATEQWLRADYAALQETAATATNTYVEAETANKAVITNLVNQVGDLQGKVTTLTCEKAEVEASLARWHEQMDEERGEHKLLVLQLERDLSTTTTLQQEAEARVVQLSADNEQMQRKIEQNSIDMLALRETIASHEIKLEEVTLSEQELAWKVSTLQETIKNMPDPVAHDREIERLESDKKELKNTVHKLSVKLYKVVGFLDEMVQEQDAIIAESLTNATGASPLFSGSQNASDGSTSTDDRQKMLSSVTGMKEQIGAIIESVLGNMPDYRVSDEDDDEDDEDAVEQEIEV